MKTVKKLIAALACVALLLGCFAGCHEKGATVATVTLDKKEYSVPAGVYLTMLISADSEARSKVAEAITAEDADADTSNINFSKQTVTADDKKEYKFNDYVLMRAKELVSEYLVTKYMFAKYDLKLSDESQSAMEQYVAYQWAYNGNAYLFEPNGISYDSYQEYMKVNMYYRSDVFDYFYNEGGEKAPAKADIEKAIKEHFTAANILEISVKDDDGKDLAEDKLTEIADKIQGYCDRINDGKATFAEIKEEYDAENKKAEEKDEEDHEDHDHDHEDAEAEDEAEDTEEDETAKPKDETAVVVGDDETSVASQNFAEITKLEVGKATLLKCTDGYYRLVINQDILADEYYFDTYRDETVRIMHAEDFNDYVAKEAKKLKITYDSYEIDYLSPKKISYDTYNQWYSDALSNYTTEQ